MKRTSIWLRLTLIALGTSLLALVLAGVVVSGLLRSFVVETFEQSLDATMVALMAGTELDGTAGRLRVSIGAADPRFETPFSGWYWQIADSERVLVRSGSLWTADLGVGAGASSGTLHRGSGIGPQGEALHLLWRDFSVPGGTLQLRVTAALPMAEIEARSAAIIGPLLACLAVLALALAAAVAVQVRLGLRPLRDLGDGLKAIQRGEAETLPEPRHDEIAPIARELNALLAQNRETIERARAHVGNLAHGLKTPLAALSAELGRPGMDANRRAEIETLSATMDRLVSHHLRRARSAASVGLAGTRTDIGQTLAGLQPVFAGIYADRGVTLALDIPPGTVFAGEEQDLDELLGNLIDNACKWAERRVVITARREGQHIVLDIDDDGPGLSPEAAAAALERGRRFDEGRPGAGLGLGIVVDLARLYGGQLTFLKAPIGGARARLTLPAAP